MFRTFGCLEEENQKLYSSIGYSKMKKMKTSKRHQQTRRASLGAIYKESSPQPFVYADYYCGSTDEKPERYINNRRRTSLPAVLLAPNKPILMEAKHFNELTKIVTDLLKSVKDLSQPVLLSLDRIKALLEPYERRLSEKFVDYEGWHADSEPSDDEISWSSRAAHGLVMRKLMNRVQSEKKLNYNESQINEKCIQELRTIPASHKRLVSESRTEQQKDTKTYLNTIRNTNQRQIFADTSGYDTDTGAAEMIIESDGAETILSKTSHADTSKCQNVYFGNTKLNKQGESYDEKHRVPLMVTYEMNNNQIVSTTSHSGDNCDSISSLRSSTIIKADRHRRSADDRNNTNESDIKSNWSSTRSGNATDCKIDELLAQCTHWNFPIFELRDVTQEVLSKLAYRLFDLSGLFTHFRLPRDKFLSYFRALEFGYRSVAYHNSVHAADVLQSVWYLINKQSQGETRTLAQQIEMHEVLSLLLAAAIHDFDHPGYTNNFLVTTRDPLAILYNDRSVLENHHVASAWKLMLSDKKHQFLGTIDNSLLNKIRVRTIDLVLSTDLSKHFKILEHWKTRFDRHGKVSISDQNSRNTMLKMIIKFSDIANPAKEYELHKKWSKLVCEEFYMQGDQERKSGLPISPFMDRHQQDLIGNQMNFIKKVVKPCYESLSHHNYLILECQSIIGQQLEENLLTWEHTSIDNSGNLIAPPQDAVKQLLAEKSQGHSKQPHQKEIKDKYHKKNKPTENSSLIQEDDDDDLWQNQTGDHLPTCCAPLLSIFRRKTRQCYRK